MPARGADSRLHQEINNQGANIGVIFFGLEALIRGWLLFEPGFLPRFVGVLSMVAEQSARCGGGELHLALK